MSIGANYLERSRAIFAEYRTLAEKGMAQIDDAAFFRVPDSESNSIAIIVKHMAGNLLSRWTDFLTTDGEKPNRNRDGEFVILPVETRAALMTAWSHGYACLDQSLASLQPEDLLKMVVIRGQEMTALDAIQRALAHAAAHSGQIVYLAKLASGEQWQTLSIPRAK